MGSLGCVYTVLHNVPCATPLPRTPLLSCTTLLPCTTPLYSWPGVAKPLDQYGPSGTPANDKGGDDDDDDDFDLFGSDDEADVRV
jgi:hypothetical protein